MSSYSTSAFFLICIISSCFTLNHVSCAETKDTLKPGQVLHDWEQLVSSGKVFRLGFFNPNPNTLHLGTSGPRYLGIWFNDIPFYTVWVANRENPIPDSSGTLLIDPEGKLKIRHLGSNNSPIVINPNQPSPNNKTNSSFALTLLDSGNLVVRRTDRNENPGSVLWQSFDYPHNMLLPGMKLGANLKTGKTWELTSWLSDKVPSPGAFKLTLDPSGIDQLLVSRRGQVYWSTGVFRNGSFQNATSLTGFTKDSGILKFVRNREERYFTYSIRDGPALSRMDLDTLGQITLFTLDERRQSKSWIFDTAGSLCPAGVGNEGVGVCLAEEGGSGCRNGSEVFVARRGYMTGEERYSGEVVGGGLLSLSDCHGECWRNCSCVAYQAASYDQTGCRFWSRGSNFTADEFIGLEDVVDLVYLLSYLPEPK